ncbi:hypothetical protein HanRHA438_Chr10g0437921 [Helianthus annuus]|nr:hypothetical protein HanRHA438_Chr10g0437921 [Helianthus annuus]KAJ0882533.1 hypothetical protein HanPSC8_Chr10g0410781 [Helianthus annuus]
MDGLMEPLELWYGLKVETNRIEDLSYPHNIICKGEDGVSKMSIWSLNHTQKHMDHHNVLH